MADEDYQELPHVERGVRNSDCRTPVILVEEDGDPFPTLSALAKEVDSGIWAFDLEQIKNATNVMDYIDVGIQNGDWVYIKNCDTVEPSFFQEVIRTIYTLAPNPTKFPRREFFRSFFVVKKPFDLNGIRFPFPTLMMKSSIVARKAGEMSKWSCPIPVDQPQYVVAVKKHEERREVGRDSDSESDLDEHVQFSGMRFYRSAELSKNADNSPLALAKDVFLKSLKEEDVDTMKKLVDAGEINPMAKLKNGMTPLQYSVCLQLPKAVKYLLDIGADPNQPRESDKRPPIFMAIDDKTIAKALIDAGADLFTKYQGCRLDTHPDTDPEIAAYAKARREEA